MYHVSINKKKARIPILISDKTEFRPSKLIKNKEGSYIMIKQSVPQEDIIVFNMHAPNSRALKYVKQELIELQGEINESTITLDMSNTSL